MMKTLCALLNQHAPLRAHALPPEAWDTLADGNKSVSVVCDANIPHCLLAGTPIHNALLGSLSLLPLHHLALADTGVTDEGVGQLLGMTTLTHLDLKNSQAGDGALAVLAQLPALQSLELSGTEFAGGGLGRWRGRRRRRCELCISQHVAPELHVVQLAWGLQASVGHLWLHVMFWEASHGGMRGWQSCVCRQPVRE